MVCLVGADYVAANAAYSAGVTAATAIRQGGAIALAADNAAQLISNWRKQRDIASRSLAISEEERQHVKSVYWPKELAFLYEFGTPEEVEEVDVYGRRYAGHLIAGIAKVFAKKIKELRCTAGRYCTSQFARNMQDLYQAQATVVTNAKIMGYCMGFIYAQSKRDLNNERRRQAIALSKGLLGEAANSLRSAGEGLSSLGANFMNGISRAIESFKMAEKTTTQSVTPINGSGTAASNIANQYVKDRLAEDPEYAMKNGLTNMNSSINDMYTNNDYNMPLTADGGQFAGRWSNDMVKDLDFVPSSWGIGVSIPPIALINANSFSAANGQVMHDGKVYYLSAHKDGFLSPA